MSLTVGSRVTLLVRYGMSVAKQSTPASRSRSSEMRISSLNGPPKNWMPGSSPRINW
ncbi:Uncharacterised protein [Mycobacterium tuberculosis]|nr:Uncharacterised protein [Mycobacterium tuberculosis]